MHRALPLLSILWLGAAACASTPASDADPVGMLDGAMGGTGGGMQPVGGGGMAGPAPGSHDGAQDATQSTVDAASAADATVELDAELSSDASWLDAEIEGGACEAATSTCAEECSAPEDCPEPDAACEIRTCTNGRCAIAPASDGIACDDGDACTQVDACRAGACEGGDRVHCAASDGCHLGACDPATGTCLSPAQRDGFVCDDGDINVCTWRDTCVGGVCTAGIAVPCSGGGHCESGACVAPPCVGGLAFPTPPMLVVDGYPYAIVSADFDRDGELDVATADYADDQVSVFLGLGGARFAEPVSYAAGAQPYAIAAGDLNGDGDVDLAVVNRQSDDVSLFFGAGEGAFEPAVSLTTGASPGAVAAGDLNGDGSSDLVVASSGDVQLTIHFNDGEGAFSHVVIPLETPAYDIGIVDLNGDGARDLVIARPDPFWFNLQGSVVVLLNRGDGSFDVAGSQPLSSGPYSITHADFDGDGAADVAVACRNAHTTQVFLNAGGGELLAGSAYDQVHAYQTSDVEAADVDDDAFADLVVTSYENGGPGSANVLRNRGDGTFLPPDEYAFGAAPESATVGDFNGDGALDLLSAGAGGNDMVPLLNLGDGTFLRHARNDDLYSGQPLVADVDADGDVDLVLPGIEAGVIAIARNNGAGVFGTREPQDAPNGSRAVAFADFDGDGRNDIAAHAGANQSLTILYADGVGFRQGVPQPTPGVLHAVVAGDFDHDGRVDLAVTTMSSATYRLSIMRNRGDGTFATYGAHELESAASLAAADLDGDDRLDLVSFGGAAVRGDETVQVSLNLGDGTFGDPRDVASRGAAHVALADFNDDGAVDIAHTMVAQATRYPVTVRFNDGHGVFSTRGDYFTDSSPGAIAVADLDGDARPDIIALQGRLTVLLNTASGLGPPRYYLTGDGPVGIVIADIDNDGRQDALVHSSEDQTLNMHFNRCL